MLNKDKRMGVKNDAALCEKSGFEQPKIRKI